MSVAKRVSEDRREALPWVRSFHALRGLIDFVDADHLALGQDVLPDTEVEQFLGLSDPGIRHGAACRGGTGSARAKSSYAFGLPQEPPLFASDLARPQGRIGVSRLRPGNVRLLLAATTLFAP
jgi:hypothetical protein